VTLVGFGVNMGLGTAEVVVLVRRLGCVNEIEIIFVNDRCFSWRKSLCSPCLQAGTGANRLHTCDATRSTTRDGNTRAWFYELIVCRWLDRFFNGTQVGVKARLTHRGPR
jgi:hypothetical protein